MSWIKLDDQWMRHPKIVRAGRDARDMWLASLTWCAEYLTDGYFPENLLPQLAVMAGVDVANCQTFASTLLDVCLWEHTDNGYYIHDYHKYNPTKEQVEATRNARSEAGRHGGDAKAAKSKQSPGNLLANDLANPKQKSAPYPYPLIKNDEDDSGDGDEKKGDTLEDFPPPPPPIYDIKPGTIIDGTQAVRIFTEVTGMVTIPAMPDQSIDAICQLTRKYGGSVIGFLKPFFQAQTLTVSKTGHTYPKTSMYWLNTWAVGEELPDFVTDQIRRLPPDDLQPELRAWLTAHPKKETAKPPETGIPTEAERADKAAKTRAIIEVAKAKRAAELAQGATQ